MNIQKASSKDATNLTALTIRSKSYWKYDIKYIEEWKESLTITENYILTKHVFKLKANKSLIGFYAYYPENETDIRLDFLFVDPPFIGNNYGRFLITDFLKRVKKTNARRIIVDADPNVKYFYSKFGFCVIGQAKSVIKQRFLPIMELKLNI